MKISYAEFQQQSRRLELLRALKQAVQYRANALLLKSFCDAVGHAVSTDRLQADLAWLAEQSLVTLEQHEATTVATLTTRGLDVANGSAHAPGVARPQPGG